MLNLVPWSTPLGISPGLPQVWLGNTVKRKKEMQLIIAFIIINFKNSIPYTNMAKLGYGMYFHNRFQLITDIFTFKADSGTQFLV